MFTCCIIKLMIASVIVSKCINNCAVVFVKCSILCMVRALVTKIILHLNHDLYSDFDTSETLSKMCLLKKGTLSFLDLQYIYSHLSSHKHHVHSNLSHQFTQHQHYD